MKSWHEWGARRAFEEDLAGVGAQAVYEVVELGRAAAWCDDPQCRHRLLARVVGQVHQDVESLEQLWCRGQVESLLETGRVRLVSVPVGQGPVADREAERNERVLREALAAQPVTLSVWASTGGVSDDGWVHWQAPLAVMASEEADIDAEPQIVLSEVRAALKVGSTLPSRTLLHLLADGAVWRWPYGSDRLWLLAAVVPSESGWRVRPVGWDRMERVAPDAWAPPAPMNVEGRGRKPVDGAPPLSEAQRD